MTALDLKLRQHSVDGYFENSAVAELSQLLDAHGVVVNRPWRQTRTLGVSGAFEEKSVHFDLPSGGRYSIRVRLPRGSDIEREIVVDPGETRSEVIDLPGSPHEYLGWQQFSGLLGPAETRRSRSTDQLPPEASKRQLAWLDALKVRQAEEDDLFERIGEVPLAYAACLPPGVEAWRQRAPEVVSPVPFNWASKLHDDYYCLWTPSLPSSDECGQLIWALRGETLKPETRARYPAWLVFDRQEQCEAAIIPWIWWGMKGPSEDRRANEGLRLFYERGSPNPIDRDQPGRLVVSVQDSRWGGLLEFVASGRLYEAAELAEDILRREPPEEALYGKVRSPLAATLGGIVLIATKSATEKQAWDQWLANLADWFPGLPDGAVLYGYRLLQLGQYDEARARLREGLERGIPYFAATIRMLAIGFSQLEDDEGLNLVSTVASRVDPGQAFTVLRLPGSI